MNHLPLAVTPFSHLNETFRNIAFQNIYDHLKQPAKYGMEVNFFTI